MELVGDNGEATDSLRVACHYMMDNAKVERIEADGRALLARDYASFIDEIAAFSAGNSEFDDMGALLDRYWRDESALAPDADGSRGKSLAQKLAPNPRTAARRRLAPPPTPPLPDDGFSSGTPVSGSRSSALKPSRGKSSRLTFPQSRRHPLRKAC